MKGEAELVVHQRTDAYAIATYGPVLLQLWHLSAPLDGAQAARRVASELAKAGFEKTGSLVVVPEQSAIPENAARDELRHVPMELTNGAGLVMVQEGVGFKASAVRAVLATIMLLSRQSIPHDVVPNVIAGSGWLAKRLKVPGGTRGLIAAVAELRSLYDPPGSALRASGS